MVCLHIAHILDLVNWFHVIDVCRPFGSPLPGESELPSALLHQAQLRGGCWRAQDVLGADLGAQSSFFWSLLLSFHCYHYLLCNCTSKPDVGSSSRAVLVLAGLEVHLHT